MPDMTLCFVEDERRTIAEVIVKLQATRFFRIQEFTGYSAVDDQVLRDTDLFVLDVLTEDSPEAFCRFIRVLRDQHKPFLAFTRVPEERPIEFLPGKPRLRDVVFEYGGLGLLSKISPPDDPQHPSHQDLRFALIERILWFYWCSLTKRGA